MKYYYTDALEAAWMAKEFGIKYRAIGKPYINSNVTMTDLGKDDIMNIEYGRECFYESPNKYYIHPDCHEMLKPQMGDMVESDAEYILINYDAELFDIRHGINKIIQRNGKAFFPPEVSND